MLVEDTDQPPGVLGKAGSAVSPHSVRTGHRGVRQPDPRVNSGVFAHSVVSHPQGGAQARELVAERDLGGQEGVAEVLDELRLGAVHPLGAVRLDAAVPLRGAEDRPEGGAHRRVGRAARGAQHPHRVAAEVLGRGRLGQELGHKVHPQAGAGAGGHRGAHHDARPRVHLAYVRDHRLDDGQVHPARRREHGGGHRDEDQVGGDRVSQGGARRVAGGGALVVRHHSHLGAPQRAHRASNESTPNYAYFHHPCIKPSPHF